MRSFGKSLGRILLLALIGAVFWAVAPREPVERSAPLSLPEFATALEAGEWWDARDANVPDLRSAASPPVIWASEPGSRSETIVVYIHGFSASAAEIRPVPDLVAEALDANLLFVRLRGHGRTGEAMAEATAGAWLDDLAEVLHVARALGDRIIVIATSTGGTLSAYAALEPDMADGIAGIAFISPNFRPVNRITGLLNWPFARHWLPLVAGETRSFEPANEGQAAHWTTSYPSVAALPMAAIVRETIARDYAQVSIPALFVVSEDDQVVSAAATRRFADRWGGAHDFVAVALPESGVDPSNHVIAGDIMSPAMTAIVAERLIEWSRGILP